MKVVVDPGMLVATLDAWTGANAEVWLFHTTHKRLALALSRPNEPETLYVIATGCQHMTGPFSWPSAKISVSHGRSKRGSEDVYFVLDEEAEFSLRCSSVTLARGPSTELDSSFDSFLGGAPKPD